MGIAQIIQAPIGICLFMGGVKERSLGKHNMELEVRLPHRCIEQPRLL